MHKNIQAPNSVLMIRPAAFYPNPDTQACNSFQAQVVAKSKHPSLLKKVLNEFDQTVALLNEAGIKVFVVQDNATPAQPDAIFPNNWFSTHGDGKALIYPMFSPLRRTEKQALPLIQKQLAKGHNIKAVVDFSHREKQDQFFEGTGAMCIDHQANIAYIAMSNRADSQLAKEICDELNLKPLLFNTTDNSGNAVYHTNVILSIGENFALLGADMITDTQHKNAVISSLENSGKKVIKLTNQQINHFAANAIELKVGSKHYLAMSTAGKASLDRNQIEQIECFATILSTPLPTIELSGGSMRCMIAAIHL